MVKFTIRLLIVILVTLSITNKVNAGWYDTASDMHKEWAKEYHTEEDSVRYTNIHNDVIGHDIKLKFGTLKFPGIVMQKSLTSKSKNFAEVIGAQEIAYNGNTFHSIVVDHSKCYVNYEFSDCGQDMGSSRTELITKSSAYNFSEGKEAWINYAVLPAYNMIFKNTSRKDDIISATYLFLTLLNQQHFPLFDKSWRPCYKNDYEMREKFIELQNHKSEHSLSKMSQNLHYFTL